MWRNLIIGIVLFSFLPTFYELSKVHTIRPERSFELVHNFPTDYNFYLSRIRQGIEGRWTAYETYTSEPHRGSLIHEMYIGMGRVGQFVRVPWGRSGDVYHVARFVLSITFVAAIAWFTKYNVLAFLLAITASSWPTFVVVDGIPRLGGYMSWWSVMDSLQRISFIPHILVGQILMLFLIVMLTRKNLMQKNIIFLGLLGFVLGMIFPPGLVFVYAVLGVYCLLQKKFVTSFVSFFFLSVSSLVYLMLMTSFYPWKRLAEVDVIRPLPFDYLEYAKALGPIGPIGLIGLVWALIKKEMNLYPAVAWVIAWMGLLGVFKFIPAQSPLRFSEMIPHVPLAVLAVYMFSKKKLLFLPVVLIVLGFFQMFSSFLWQKDFVDHKMRATSPLVPYDSYVMYPLKDFMSAISFIQDRYPRKAIILAEFTASNYIPVYAGNTVYAGHDNTVELEQKRIIVKQFYAGKLTDPKIFLEKNEIAAIFYGPQEKQLLGLGDLSSLYPFLREVYKNSYVKIYEIF